MVILRSYVCPCPVQQAYALLHILGEYDQGPSMIATLRLFLSLISTISSL